MSKFRILSIFLAVGLLVGALGVGPVLAGQIDVTGLDTRDASYAPYALDVDEGEVEWATGMGADVAAASYANDSRMAVFYINDDDLESTSDEQIATWGRHGSSADGGFWRRCQYRHSLFKRQESEGGSARTWPR